MSASPTWVAVDVDVGSPERKTLIDLQRTILLGNLIFGSRLIRCSSEHIIYHTVIKRGSHTDGLREDGGKTGTCHSMKSLVPPIILFYSETGHCRRFMFHQRHFLRKRHLLDYAHRPLMGRSSVILIYLCRHRQCRCQCT